MRNLSQKMKLLLVFFITACIPISCIAVINSINSYKGQHNVANELIIDRLDHDIASAQLYIESEVGEFKKEGDQLVGAEGTSLDNRNDIIDLVSEKLGAEATVFVKIGASYVRYLTSLVDTKTGERQVGTELDPNSNAYKAIERGEIYTGEIQLFGENFLCAYEPFKDNNGETMYVIFLGISMADAESMIGSQVKSSIVSNILVTGFIFIFDIICILIVSNMMTKPLLLLKDKAKELAAYDFSSNVSENLLNRRDEIGVVAQAINQIIDNIRNILTTVNDKSESVNDVAKILEETCSKVATVAGELGKTVTEIADGASNQANSTTECLNCLEALGTEVHSNTEKMYELNTSSEKVNELVQDGKKVLKELVQKIEESNVATKEVYESIQVTNKNANEISNISGMIAAIAKQTNLLALNASIEAARAGEHGRGFHVVAGEIRKLAEQATESTKQIDEQIGILQTQVGKSVVITEKVKEMLEEQSKSVDLTEEKYHRIEDEMVATMKLSVDLDKASQKMNEQKDVAISLIENLATVAEENAAATEESSACIEEQGSSLIEISEKAGELANLTSDLDVMIQKFKIN